MKYVVENKKTGKRLTMLRNGKPYVLRWESNFKNRANHIQKQLGENWHVVTHISQEKRT